nr:hypothetical protein [Tanacetum cinerariifolium]
MWWLRLVERVVSMAWRWWSVMRWCGRLWGDEVAVAVVVVLEAGAARGGEWCGGSYILGEGNCFWGLPEKLVGKVFRRRRQCWWPAGGGRRQEGVCV